MFALATLIPFIVAAFVVTLVPGITVSAIVSTTLARGVAAGFWMELGAQAARLTMVVLVALALEVVTGAVSAAFDIIKYVGAAYLIWLGWGYIVRRHTIAIETGAAPPTPLRQMVSGFFVLWTNPKALIFFGAFLPQFVDRSHPAFAQVLVLGLIEMGAALITDSGYILVAALARGELTGSRLEIANRAAGVILIGAAVWLALQHQA